MIEVDGLGKQHGDVVRVRDVSFVARPGRVTALLGANGAGKSTILRMVVGLVTPTSGTVLVRGRPFADSPAPLHELGAAVARGAIHPSRRARDALRVIAATHGIPSARLGEVLDEVGLAAHARRRVGALSAGMRQRLALAAALLGDPPVLVLDEPTTGLDREGVAWLRLLLARWAGEGRTVLVATHAGAEMLADDDLAILVESGSVIAEARVSRLRRLDGAVAPGTAPMRLLQARLMGAAPHGRAGA